MSSHETPESPQPRLTSGLSDGDRVHAEIEARYLGADAVSRPETKQGRLSGMRAEAQDSPEVRESLRIAPLDDEGRPIVELSQPFGLKHVEFTPEFSGEQDNWPEEGWNFEPKTISMTIPPGAFDLYYRAILEQERREREAARALAEAAATSVHEARDAMVELGRRAAYFGRPLEQLGVDPNEITYTNRAARRKQARLDKRSGTR